MQCGKHCLSLPRLASGMPDGSRHLMAGPRLRSVLSTTAGMTFLFFSGSVFAWPLADLYLGPLLVLLGVRAGLVQGSPASGHEEDGATDPRRRKDFRRAEHQALSKACVVRGGQMSLITTSHEGLGSAIEKEAMRERPVLYISLREATSSRDLHMAMLRGLYSELRLGFIGTLVNSMGVYWTVLFDMLVSNDPCHNTVVNFEVALQHGRRALRKLHASGWSCISVASVPSAQVLPLIIIDHVDEAFSHGFPGSAADAERRCQWAMLQRILAWCGAVTFDEHLADVVLVGGAGFSKAAGGAWRRSKTHSRQFENMEEIRKFMSAVPHASVP
eukprot:CAMPEP_0178415588 /NCGR_PEP_ID=MMETSP0689_2-20121128/23628_1 /TAXON_ID=160604 /ORGANISM="Amphidinium massartii, Strain CS-259" /LENGTH=329 /DNA_ID=CAMNT_0020036911 /DNA_START=84 /DNA_END=1073 /DNA_ORIENTATION=+